MSKAEMLGWLLVGAIPGSVTGWLVGEFLARLIWPNR